MINLFNINSYKNSNFNGSSYYNQKFSLSKMDGIPCAYCGKKTLSLSKFDKKLYKLKSIEEFLQLGEEYKEYLDEKELQHLNKKYLTRFPLGPKIALRTLFMPHIATKEHIIPRSNGGIDDIKNYIVTCYKCNSARKSIPLYNLFKSDKNISENINNHINFLKKFIPKLIKTKKIAPKYKHYPEIISESIKVASNNQLDIKI